MFTRKSLYKLFLVSLCVFLLLFALHAFWLKWAVLERIKNSEGDKQSELLIKYDAKLHYLILPGMSAQEITSIIGPPLNPGNDVIWYYPKISNYVGYASEVTGWVILFYKGKSLTRLEAKSGIGLDPWYAYRENGIEEKEIGNILGPYKWLDSSPFDIKNSNWIGPPEAEPKRNFPNS